MIREFKIARYLTAVGLMLALVLGFGAALPAQAQVTTGSLTVTKVVNGGPSVASDFTILVDGVSVTSGVATTTLSAGVHTVTEGNLPGYTASFSGDCNASGQVTITVGATSTCTITNTFTGIPVATSTLMVNKVVVGGPNIVSDFPIFLNGMAISSGVATTTATGTFTVTETNRPGYTATFSGACNAFGQVTLGAGGNATCVITNVFAATTGTTGAGNNPPLVTTLGAQQTPGVPSTGAGPTEDGMNDALFLTLAVFVAAVGAGFLISPLAGARVRK